MHIPFIHEDNQDTAQSGPTPEAMHKENKQN